VGPEKSHRGRGAFRGGKGGGETESGWGGTPIEGEAVAERMV